MAALPTESTLLPHPPFSITLAPLDSLHPEHYSCRLLLFHCSSPAQRALQLSSLRTGLQKLIQKCPILGGKVVPSPDQPDGNFTIVPSTGLEFIVKDLSAELSCMKELEDRNFESKYLPDRLLNPILGREREGAACKVQVSAIEGGSILSWVVSHRVCDGSGTNELMRMLSSFVKSASSSSELRKDEAGEGQDGEKELVGMDRTLLRDITSTIPFKIEEHPAYNLPSPSPTTTNSTQQQKPHPFTAPHPEKSILLHLSPTALTRLKADASAHSTHDALLSLIWTTTMSLRSQRSPNTPTTDIETKIFFPSDARHHLGLPQSYIGNSVYQLTASLPLSVLLGDDGLRAGAAAIREAIRGVSSERVGCYMARLKEKGWLDWGFMQGTNSVNVALGTDWTSGGLYELDFGDAWGGKGVVRFRYPGDEGAFCCMFPKLRDGSAEFEFACLPGEEEEFVRGEKGCGKYLDI